MEECDILEIIGSSMEILRALQAHDPQRTGCRCETRHKGKTYAVRIRNEATGFGISMDEIQTDGK